MTTPGLPCGWAVDPSSVSHWDDATPTQQGTAAAVAVYVVWALSGRRYGVCESVFRPPQPSRYQLCVDGGRLESVTLPPPAVSVDKVLIDGVVLPPSEYMLFDGSLFGNAPWPVLQDLSKPDTEIGTWSVTYQRGVPVPGAGNWAAGVLAGEILRSMTNMSGPRIPWRAQSVAREGVNIQLLDPELFLEAGKTGIPEVDMFIEASNPHGLRTAPVVWSPDVDMAGIVPEIVPRFWP